MEGKMPLVTEKVRAERWREHKLVKSKRAFQQHGQHRLNDRLRFIHSL